MNIKIKNSIELLKKLETNKIYNLAFSGGKDSVVILDLIKRSGCMFESTYSNTTIDPPGTIKFIKENYPEVKIIQPEKSFYQLVVEKGLPTRKGRFCCEYLKERYGIGRRNVDGTRWDESINRRKYTPEDCDTRKRMKGAIHIRPILNWTNNDVWRYIKSNNLSYIKYYDPPYNFKRHGCVGCPYGGAKQQIREYQFFPKYALAILKAIRKHMELKPNNKIAKNFDNEYEVFHWWLSKLSIDNYVALRNSSLFPISNYKNLILNVIYQNQKS